MSSQVIKLKKGYDIKLQGSAEKTMKAEYKPNLFAVKPTDFQGMSPIPKLLVAEGDTVQAGDTVFFDKKAPSIMHAAPVSGEVVEIRRGAKRKILAVVIKADHASGFKDFGAIDPAGASREDIVTRMLESGIWPAIRQRPYNVVADPELTPRAIFISGFDSAPLAPDYGFTFADTADLFQAGVNVLAKLTEGKIYLGVNQASKAAFGNTTGVTITQFDGAHPAGNVGVQIHHLAPINKGETVWTLRPHDIVTLGRLFSKGQYDPQRTVALTGSEIKETGYHLTRTGACIDGLVNNNLKDDHVRYISGNVLTGERIDKDGFLGYFADQVTVIPEGDQSEFLGWLVPSYARPSLSRTFLSFLRPNREYVVNSNRHGDERAYVVTGEYEKVLPMDMLPQHLIKSIMYQDLDEMEGLGIYEVVEEDLALCEFVCSSKVEVQAILREGLDIMREQG